MERETKDTIRTSEYKHYQDILNYVPETVEGQNQNVSSNH